MTSAANLLPRHPLANRPVFNGLIHRTWKLVQRHDHVRVLCMGIHALQDNVPDQYKALFNNKKVRVTGVHTNTVEQTLCLMRRSIVLDSGGLGVSTSLLKQSVIYQHECFTTQAGQDGVPFQLQRLVCLQRNAACNTGGPPAGCMSRTSRVSLPTLHPPCTHMQAHLHTLIYAAKRFNLSRHMQPACAHTLPTPVCIRAQACSPRKLGPLQAQ